MDRKPLLILPQAARDIDEAKRHYRRVAGTNVAERFLMELRRAFRHLSRWPSAGSPCPTDAVGTGVRMWRLRRYPQLLFYSELGARVVLLAVPHERSLAASHFRDAE